MRRYKTLMFIISSALLFSNTAMASKFVISASTSSGNILVASYELQSDHQIKLQGFKTIPKEAVYTTTVALRMNRNTAVFDIYQPRLFQGNQWPTVLKMISLDSNLNLVSEQDITDVPNAYFTLESAKLNGPFAFGRFLLMALPDMRVVVRKLNAKGIPGIETDAFDTPPNSMLLEATVSEDGKMLAVSTSTNESNQKSIYVRNLNPAGPIIVRHTSDVPKSLSLTDPIDNAQSSRFLFYRDYRDLGKSRIMLQMIDNLSANFIGEPRVFTPLKSGPCGYFCFLQSVAVTPKGDIVFYTDFDSSCRKYVLKGQVFNPQTAKKIRGPQLLIGCNRIPGKGGGWVWDGIYGIDVAQF